MENTRFLNKSTIHNGIYKRSNGMSDHYDVYSNNDRSMLKLEFDHSMFNFNPDLDLNKYSSDVRRKDLILTDDDKTKLQLIKREVYLLKPDFIYTQICDSARVIQKIATLEKKIAPIFDIRISKNLINLKTFSPLFYSEHCKNRENFIVYQVLIYLCVLIEYVFENRENQEFIKMDSEITKIIDWVQCRNLPDLSYIIIGPTVNTNYQIDYKNLYKYLISPANSSLKYGDNITEYMQLMSSRTIEKLISENNNIIQTKPNSYDKLQNISETFLIYFDTDNGCLFNYNKNDDLIINCQNINIGNVSEDKMNLRYDEKINTNKLLNIDPKTASGQLNKLLMKYNTIKLNNLLISASVYQTKLNVFEKVYVVFPNIYMYTRTNNIYNTGTLQISGKFIFNEQYYYEFIPDRLEGISYKSLTAYVKDISFYISDKPTKKNNIISYKPFLKFSKNILYNIPIIINHRVIPKNKSNYIIEFYFIDEYNNIKVLNKNSFIYNSDYSIIQLLNTEPIETTTSIEYITDCFDFNYDNDMDYNSNKYKAFYTDVKIINSEWNLEDYLLSLALITTETHSLTMLKNIKGHNFIHMNLRPVYNLINDINYRDGFYKVDIYYKINKIIHTSPFLLINADAKDISGISVSINDDPNKYVIRRINNTLLQIKYNQHINNDFIIVNNDHNIKMILELL